MQLISVIKAFLLSIKGTWIVKTAILAPFVLICLRLLLVLFDRDNNFTKHAWEYFFTGNYSFWFGLLFPILIALTCSLLIDNDKPIRTLLFAFPIQRKAFYISKVIIAFSIMVFGSIVLLILSLISGFILAAIKPSSGFTFEVPHLLDYFEILITACFASIIQVAISIWAAMRTSSFVIALSIGLTGSLINLVGIQNVFIQKFWLWIYPLDVIGVLSAGTHYAGWSIPLLLFFCFAGSVVFSYFGIIKLENRDII